MADPITELLKRKVNALESAYAELSRKFSRANVNGLDTLVAQSLFPYREIHGPWRDSIDSSHPITFVVDYDENVAYLYKAELKIRVKAVRSNVSAASGAAGGGSSPTSSAGSAHTHSISQSLTSASGGGTVTTSSGGSAHIHSISATASATESATQSLSGFANTSSITTGGPSVVSTGLQSANPPSDHDHSLQSHTHTATTASNIIVAAQNHTHNVSGQTAAAESAHTHAVTVPDHTHTVSGSITAASESAHTHTVTISSHSHTITMTYGIYEGSAPSTPQITVTINGTDHTAALGGPWDADVTLDITNYLRDGAQIPLRQDNNIVLTSNELIDMEVVCRSLVTAKNVTG